MSYRRNFGNLGEDIACRFLIKRGFKIIKRNYLRKWGEIDIVAYYNNHLRFIEVKTVSCENVGRSDLLNDQYRAEDNVHKSKLKRLSRVIQSYIAEGSFSRETNWQFDLITVSLSLSARQARVKFIEDLVL
jgi:putative endonuclease